MNRLATTSVIAALLAGAAAPASADWRAEIGDSYNIGLLGGENEADRLRRYDCLVDLASEALGMDVELFPASDYAGVMQGLLAGQLHQAGLGASGYAGIHTQDPEAVEPVLTTVNADGSLGYYAPIYVRADSAFETIEDLEGASLAYADPNSTSGYLVPRFELAQAGIDDEEFFGRTGFAGGHEQAVVAVLDGQYDAGVTWSSMIGDHADGYTRGNFRRMVENGLVDMNDIRVIWESQLIPNGPTVLRQDLPQEARTRIVELYTTMIDAHPDCYADVIGGDGEGFAEVSHADYEGIVEMRRREIEQSR